MIGQALLDLRRAYRPRDHQVHFLAEELVGQRMHVAFLIGHDLSPDGRYWRWMPALSATSIQRATCALTLSVICFGVLLFGMPPRPRKRSCTFGSAIPRRSSWLSFSTTGRGTPCVVATPTHAIIS